MRNFYKTLFFASFIFLFLPASTIAQVTGVQDADLYAESITITPKNPVVNQKCKVIVKIKNLGEVGLISSLGLSWYDYKIDDFIHEGMERTNPSYSKVIRKNDYIEYVFDGYFTSAGVKKASFTVDKTDELDEYLEDNNSVSAELKIMPETLPDITIDSIEFSPKNIIINQDVDVVITIKSSSSVAVLDEKGLGENDLNLYFNEPAFIISSSSHTIYPTITSPLYISSSTVKDELKEVKYTFRGKFTKFGEYNVSAVIDRNNRLPESNENNNSLTKAVRVYFDQDDVDQFNVLNFGVDMVSSSSVKVFWNTDKAAIGTVFFKGVTYTTYDWYKSANSISAWPTIQGSSTKPYVIIENLRPNTQHEYYIFGKQGNATNYTNQGYFTTLVSDDLKFVAMPIKSVNNIASSTAITWQTNLISNSAVYYKKASDLTYISTTSLEAVINHSMLLDGLSPAEYYFYVMSSSTLQATSTVVTSVKSDIYRFVIDNSEVEADTDDSVDDNTDGRNIIPMIARDSALYERLKGSIVLRVDDHGEAWYLNPLDDRKYYLGRPDDAFNIMKGLAIGITNKDLAKIPIAGEHLPLNWRSSLDYIFTRAHKGKIFLQVEGHGEAWYVNPTDEKRYYLGRPADAFQIMRDLSIGVTSVDFKKL